MFDMFDMFNEEKKDEQSEEVSSPVPTATYSPTGNFFSISIGGSVLISEKPDVAKIAKFSESINNLAREGYKFALVVGGGKACRNYQAAAKALGANNSFLDEIGIKVTRVNASLLTQTIDSAYPTVLTNVSRVPEIVEGGKIPILGGLLPGITTDAVATLVAEKMNGTFINLSNVDGVYSADPKRSKTAKFYPELSYERLISIIQVAETKPGQNVVLDLPASLILKRSKIKGIFLNGDDLTNFESAVRGGEFHGTLVTEEISEAEATTTGKRIPRKKVEIYEGEEEDEEPPNEHNINF
ncbi:MAG: UMP kinase [Candidatus Diapherotrites archaeon]|uniref:UMP kinase n=1 Tax=Candidatus Iainarchaeum sp. TaxID=3101447 RepID=A0A2D6M1B9_9ARCH|nr:UMP kinase [Candidatus Diapherotrites archaeon]|tara:strand:+ start:278 stop:1171 length:894 start_codon:yes stop_codon:yes gene_type:complete